MMHAFLGLACGIGHDGGVPGASQRLCGPAVGTPAYHGARGWCSSDCALRHSCSSSFLLALVAVNLAQLAGYASTGRWRTLRLPTVTYVT
jgi:hypothetical protein